MTKCGKVLRGVAVVLMGLTATFTLLGAVGTSCIAWNASQYGKAFAMYVPYMPVYQILVFVKLAVAVVGILATYALVRGDRWGYAGALVALVLGLATAAIQMYYTSTLKGKPFFATPPTNMRFFVTLVTLIVFLVLRIPGIWGKVGLGRPQHGRGSAMLSGGLAMFLGGVVSLATPMWAGPTHMLDGYNLVYVVEAPLLAIGTAMAVLGVGLLVAAGVRVRGEQAVRQESAL